MGRDNVLFIHLTLVPYLRAADEVKTKPTQHSVGMLRQAGIQPDILICRTEKDLTAEQKDKIALFCNVERGAVIEERDVKPFLYEIPLILVEQRLDALIIKKLGLRTNGDNIGRWLSMLEVLKNPQDSVEIAVVGKYIGLQSAYESIYEALTHGGIGNNTRTRVRRIESEDIEKGSTAEQLEGCQGILVPGGFGERGIEGKIAAIKYARENKIPFFGICLGMQCTTIEFARNVCGLKGADSTEFNANTPHPVISLLEEQKQVKAKGGTMRLGAQACVLSENTLARGAYGEENISERHRHRYEFNNAYIERFASMGMVFSGLSPDGQLVEIMELKGHPWFVAVQFHPEFKSKPTNPHLLFKDFIRAALQYKK